MAGAMALVGAPTPRRHIIYGSSQLVPAAASCSRLQNWMGCFAGGDVGVRDLLHGVERGLDRPLPPLL